jgi:hypothetical protein
MLELAILKTFNSVTHRANVQLAGSLTTYLDDIPISVSIPGSSLVIGNRVIVAIPGGNIRDAVIIATWPGGTPPGGDFFALTRFLRASRYHTFPSGTHVNMTLTANLLYAVPFISPIPRTATRIACSVVTAATGSIRLGIYQDDGSIYPGSLILDAGIVASDTAGFREITGLGVPIAANTLYWLVLVANATPAIAASSVGTSWSLLGFSTALNTAASAHFTVSFTFAPLPATFPAGATASLSHIPRIALFF